MLPSRFILASLALAFGSTSARALTWETTNQNLMIDASTPETVVEFPFKNDSSAPVSFIEVKTGCGCSVPELPKQPIPVGGEGVLKVRYHPGTHAGTRQISVLVRSDEAGDAATTTLRFKATVEPALVISPLLSRWSRRDASLSPKEVTISGTGKGEVTAVKLLPPPATVTASLKPGEKPATWLLSVAPVSLDANLTTKVQIQAEVNGRSLIYGVYVVVR